VMIFLILPVTPMSAISGRSRPMRPGFPSRTHRCRSFEEAHTLLGRRACACRERRMLYKNCDYLLKHLLGFIFYKL
jgi:hypothetical protein